MAYSEALISKVRKALAHIPNVKENKMYGSTAFMVNGKLCMSIGDHRIMCRIDPAIHEAAIKRKGCRTVEMRGREYRGYVYVNDGAVKTKKRF
ncbi:MAG: TfoX/Sxy family protein [Chloroflexi bacterium]|nr:TfoX/Sxy family protein [Chloroflexota bacterium]MCL5275972.1 TfoX/Sxy family protein [Chloroflexota bacterium]